MSQNPLEAFKRMREGVRQIMLGWVVLGVSLLMFLVVAVGAVYAGAGEGGVLAGLIIMVILMIIGGIISLKGLYGNFIPGAGELARIDQRYSTGVSFMRIGLVWGLVLLIVGAILTLLIIGIFLVLAAYVLLIIGYVGLVIFSFNLNSIEGNSNFMIAGILYIVGILIPIFTIVAWLLLYAGLGDCVRKYSQAPPSPAPPPSLPPV
ncbi:MAG: hypothetical protein QXO22_07260 [Thermosphaera sp.]